MPQRSVFSTPSQKHFVSFLIVGICLMLTTAAWAVNPYAKSDDTWISISGTIDSVAPNSFILDYGEGNITVEMDDWDRDADGYKLVKGDKVTVNGMIDDDTFDTRTIEAGSVYVENLNTYFFASPVDEEDTFVTVTTPVVVAETVIQGTVTSVNDDEFTINTGLREVKIEVEEMPFNPLDNEGYLKIELGDVVRVTGTMDDDLFEGRELVADSIIELAD